MESMTGYARVEDSTAQFSFSVEIKSLNNKYLETYLSLPRILSSEEPFFADILKRYFCRGKIELGVDVFDWKEARAVSIDAELMKRYYAELQAFRSATGASESFNLDALLSMEGVVQKGRSTVSPESMGALATAVESAAKEAVQMRNEEGNALEKDLLSCVQTIADNLEKVQDLSAFSSADRLEVLRARVAKITSFGL